jgi:hypothetical protein
MVYSDVEKMINSIDFFMKAESMPLTEEDRTILKNCLDTNENANQALQEIIRRHTEVSMGC